MSLSSLLYIVFSGLNYFLENCMLFATMLYTYRGLILGFDQANWYFLRVVQTRGPFIVCWRHHVLVVALLVAVVVYQLLFFRLLRDDLLLLVSSHWLLCI